MLRDGRLLGRTTGVFTLQWHLTNACEASCRHCYDRSEAGVLPLAEAIRVLDELVAFCRLRRVRGQVCLTGGNPFLYPAFLEVYRAAAARGFPVSILGNAVPEARLRQVLEIVPPASYQVSLEGLEETNDALRGTGHFARTIAVLGLLRRLGVRSHVMLTLHRANLAEALPLAERLRGVADRFTFNRLAQVGEGSDLPLPTREELAAFLRSWVAAARTNRHLSMKENLLALVRPRGRRPFRGCTGHGCGAAFDFVALLPDGEVHACRKLPSPIGHLGRESLAEVWASPGARRWRDGSEGCRWCGLRNSCGGCPAVAHGAGLDPLVDRDPLCFAPSRKLLPALR
jgi:selenobiotic family peptide radical SAM maturase